MIDQSSWKFSAATACARTVGESVLASIAISGATQPPTPSRIQPAAPPKWAISAHVLSSADGYPGGGGPAGPPYPGPYPLPGP